MPFRPAGFERFQGVLDQPTDTYGWAGTDETVARNGDAVELKVNALAKVTAQATQVKVDGALDHVSHTANADEHFRRETRNKATSDATVTVLWNFTLPSSDCAYWVEAFVTAKDSGAGRAGYVIRAMVFRNSGGAATLGPSSPQADFTSESVAGWNATIAVSSNDVQVTVQGAAATTINWAGAIQYQGVAGG
ncbi:MAG TPA: hypothetical protein VG389_13765 [Myxococcota bacterium]|jgi:hypothetical protein|nr:hypothetical protein [Myxococcota bacterium]